MPVYLCQPGLGADQPWCHGIQVYAAPFDLVDVSIEDNNSNDKDTAGAAGPSNTGSTANATETATLRRRLDQRLFQARRTEEPVEDDPRRHTLVAAGATVAASNPTNDSSTGAEGGNILLSRGVQSGIAIRRIRHAEVVLVDDVCIAFGRHWLRLRWPGHRGGFAGYIALGKVTEPLSKQVVEGLQGTI